MGKPRISTLQSLLILLKAEEVTTTQNYHYKSWLTISQCAKMGIDLGLHTHLASHGDREACSSPTVCETKHRIWQTIFICELMIGGPQGMFC